MWPFATIQAEITKEAVELARKLYSEKWHYIEQMAELPPEERLFQQEIARSTLNKTVGEYAAKGL